MVGTILILKIPVLITYGTKENAVKGCDYLHLEAIRTHNKYLTFKSYKDLDHNYFPVINGKTDFNMFNWDTVANHWHSWLKESRIN